MIIKDIHVKDVITKSNLPVCDYSVNPYTGCEHACKYCYACFMKRFTNHAEDWGDFVDIKHWQPINDPKKYDGKELFIGSVTDPYQPIEEKYKRTRAQLERMKELCKERNNLYEKQNDLKGQKWKIEKSLER